MPGPLSCYNFKDSGFHHNVSYIYIVTEVKCPFLSYIKSKYYLSIYKSGRCWLEAQIQKGSRIITQVSKFSTHHEKGVKLPLLARHLVLLPFTDCNNMEIFGLMQYWSTIYLPTFLPLNIPSDLSGLWWISWWWFPYNCWETKGLCANLSGPVDPRRVGRINMKFKILGINQFIINGYKHNHYVCNSLYILYYIYVIHIVT